MSASTKHWSVGTPERMGGRITECWQGAVNSNYVTVSA
jgi:hypothetical protein